MKYFTSFGLKGVKIHKIRKIYFFLPSSNKFAIQNNPLMQLLLIFHKTNWKSENFKVLADLAVFKEIRQNKANKANKANKKTVERERG